MNERTWNDLSTRERRNELEPLGFEGDLAQRPWGELPDDVRQALDPPSKPRPAKTKKMARRRT